MLATQICEEEYYNSRISAIARINFHSYLFAYFVPFMLIYGIYSLPAAPAVSHAQESLCTAAIALNSDSFWAVFSRWLPAVQMATRWRGSSWPAGTIVTFQMGLGSAGAQRSLMAILHGIVRQRQHSRRGTNVMARLQYNGNVASPPRFPPVTAVNANRLLQHRISAKGLDQATLAVTSWRSFR